MPGQQTSVSTRKAIAFPGMISDASKNTMLASYTSEEAAAEIRFGVFVKEGTLPGQMLLLTAITEKIAGLVVHSHAHAKDVELGDTGIKPKVTATLMRKGRAFVYVEEAVTRLSPVLIRAIAVGGEMAGATRDTADAADLIDASAWARFVDDVTGAGFVEIEFDVTMQGADPLD